jgi:hypothetical protein
MKKKEYSEYRRGLRMNNRNVNYVFADQLKKLIKENFSSEKYNLLRRSGYVKLKIINNSHVPRIDFGAILEFPFYRFNFRDEVIEHYDYGDLEFQRFDLLGINFDGNFIEFN